MNQIIVICIILWLCAYQAMSRMMYEPSIVKAHQQWMTKYGRTYTNNSEMEKRLKIFKENLEYIEKFNKVGNKSYKLGLNPFADLSSEEFFSSYTGLKTSNQPSSSKMGSVSIPLDMNDDVPTNLDWREQGAVTDVKNQQSCGCCWAFSAVGAIEGIVKIKTGNLISLSEQQLVDCDPTSSGCEQGNYMDNTFNYIIQNQGIVREDEYQYKGVDQTCQLNDQMTLAAQITSYVDVPANDEQQLRLAVAQQPISVGIDVGREFQLYNGGIYSGSCGKPFDHAVTAIGYGVSDDGTKYWLIKNSWGKDWGEGGYMRLLRENGEPGGQCGIAAHASYPII